MADEIRINIDADDQASRVLDDVADKVDQLEGRDAEVTVDADDQASRTLDDVQSELRDVDGATADATVEVDDRASGDIDRVQSDLRSIDGQTARASVEVDTGGSESRLSELSDSLNDVVGGLGDLGGAAGSLGQLGAAAGPAGAIGAAAATMIGLADNAAKAAVEMRTLSEITGESVENTSKLAQIWKTTGADANDLADVIAQVNGVLADQPELVRQLGIELEGASPQDVFIQAVEAAGGLEDSQERLRIGAQLFGEEGVRQVAGVQARYDDLSNAVDSIDAPFTDEDAAAGLAYEQALSEITTALGQLATELGQSVLPSLQALIDTLNTGAGPLDDWSGGVGGLIGKLNEWTNPLSLGRKGFEAVTGAIGLGEEASRDFEGVASLVTDRLNEQATAADGAGEAIDELTQYIEDLRGALNIESDLLSAQEAIDGLEIAILEAIAAEQTWGAESEAAQDANRNLAQQTVDAKQDVLGYAEAVGGIPPEKLTEILAAIDQGNLTLADELLNGVAADRTASMTANPTGVPGAIQVLDQAANPNGEPRTAGLYAEAQATASADADLDQTANPGGRPRNAGLWAQLQNIYGAESGLNHTARGRDADMNAQADDDQAEADLNWTARDRTVRFTAEWFAGARTSSGPVPLGRAAAPSGDTGPALLGAPAGLGAPAPLAAVPVAPTIIVRVDARGSIDPYSVGRAVERASESWGRIAGQWRPGQTRMRVR